MNAVAGARLPGSPKVNANLGMQYELSVLGHAAALRADAIYVGPFFGNLQESPFTEAGDYVKVDASARVNVKNLNVDLYVRNVTNEDTFTFRGLWAGSSASLYGFRPRPRTVGLQLSYDF